MKRRTFLKAAAALSISLPIASTAQEPEVYDLATHCRPFEVPRGTLQLRLGADFGNTPAAMIGWRQPNGAWRWHRELVTDGFGIVRFAEKLGIVLRENYPNMTGGLGA